MINIKSKHTGKRPAEIDKYKKNSIFLKKSQIILNAICTRIKYKLSLKTHCPGKRNLIKGSDKCDWRTYQHLWLMNTGWIESSNLRIWTVL